MDRIINWLILIIIFVFDPLAVALVVAFNNAIKVDKGIVKKEKVIRKRELYDEVPEEDEYEDEEEEELTELQKTLLMDVESEEVLPDEARGVNPPSKEEIEKKSLIQQALKNESKKETINDGYDLTEEEVEAYYQKEGWKKPYNGKPYYTHPRFDWNKKERWINDRNAINYWMKKKGGTTQELRELKEKYPSDFTSKTY